MYTGHVHKPTVILEVVAFYDLWIWHAFFGMPRSFNDINVLDISFPYLMNIVVVMPLLQNLSSMGDNTNWDTILLMAFIQNEQPLSPIRELVKETLFAKIQEAYRKNIERVFGVLQARFVIVKGLARLWDHVH